MEKKFTKDEESLLLYLETCAVDSFGKVKSIHMNQDDFKLAEEWHKSGFIKFGRMLSTEIKRDSVRGYEYTHYVILSDDAWREVAKLRMERAKRHENINFLIESKR